MVDDDIQRCKELYNGISSQPIPAGKRREG